MNDQLSAPLTTSPRHSATAFMMYVNDVDDRHETDRITCSAGATPATQSTRDYPFDAAFSRAPGRHTREASCRGDLEDNGMRLSVCERALWNATIAFLPPHLESSRESSKNVKAK